MDPVNLRQPRRAAGRARGGRDRRGGGGGVLCNQWASREKPGAEGKGEADAALSSRLLPAARGGVGLDSYRCGCA